jgi:site-specific recombinase XerD
MELQTLTDLFCDHAQYFLGYTRATLTRYRTAIRLLQKSQDLRTISECTPDTVRAFFYRGRTERNWTASTFLTYHKSLAVFFRWCVAQQHIDSSPLEGIELPRLERRLPTRLSLHEAQRLLELVANARTGSRFHRSRNHALLATCLYAGLRRTELLRLVLADVDLEGRSILVRQGKGSRDRYVPVHPALAGILRRYLEERRLVGKRCVEVFTSVRRDEGLSVDGLRQVIVSLQKAPTPRFHLHTLRHTFATLMLEGGCDIYALSRMMGHNDIKTTTIYLAASAQHLRAQISRHPLQGARLPLGT